MKRLISIVILVGIMFTITSCTNSEKNSQLQSTNSKTDISEQVNIANQVEKRINDSISPIKSHLLISSLNVLPRSEKGYDITIRVVATGGLYIPIIANEVCPIAINEMQELNAKINSIKIEEYSENNSDKVNVDTLISWETKDGNTGLFQNIGKKDIKNLTIEQLYDEFPAAKSFEAKLLEKEKQ